MKQSRNTIAKTEILQLLHKKSYALSHAEIKAHLNVIVNRVTIYRVLERLMQEGLVHKIVNTDGTMKFAVCHNCVTVHHHNHLHFSCTNCHEVTCIDGIVPEFKLPKKYKVQEVNFTVSGICPKCSNLNLG